MDMADSSTGSLQQHTANKSHARSRQHDGKQDMAELEACVGQNLWPLEQCGPPFRAVRALRPLLFLDTAALATSPLLRELPAAAAAHFLYARAPEGLQSPMTRASLTPAQVWICLHSTDPAQCFGGLYPPQQRLIAVTEALFECDVALIMRLCVLGHAHVSPALGALAEGVGQTLLC